MANRVFKHKWRMEKEEGQDSDDDEHQSSSNNKGNCKEDHHASLQETSSDLGAFLDTSRSLGSNRAMFLSLVLEPAKVQRERIIMLAEAYAIYGALFLNGVWFIWEYGSSREFTNEPLGSVFEILCAISMFTTMYTALSAGSLWLFCIMYSTASRPNWVYSLRHWLAHMQVLQLIVYFSTASCLFIGIYNRLGDMAIVSIVTVVILALWNFIISKSIAGFMIDQMSLESFHLPLLLKIPLFYGLFRGPGKMKENATKQAEMWKARISKEKDQALSDARDNDVEMLLGEAAANLGRNNVDIKPFVVKLENDWYDSVESLEDLDVNALSKYMPHRLARHVLECLEKKKEIDVKKNLN